jgi:hypothetical protein
MRVANRGVFGSAALSLTFAINVGDPLFQQVKQALPSVLAPYVDLPLPFARCECKRWAASATSGRLLKR